MGLSEFPEKDCMNSTQFTNNTNEKQIGMAWYKFLIYFALIAGAIINIIYSFSYISGGIYFIGTNGEISAEQVYARYGIGLQVVDVLYGAFLIAFAILAFVVRHKLAKYKTDSLKFVNIFYSISVSVPLLYAVAVAAITKQDLPVQAVASALCGVVFLLVNMKYFKKRAHLFINETTLKHISKTSYEYNSESDKRSRKKSLIIGILSVVIISLLVILVILLIEINGTNSGSIPNDTGIIQSNKGCLVVALEPDVYPYSWVENGKCYGLHVDIAKELAKRNNLSVEFVLASWEDMFIGIEDGTYNIVLGVEPNEYRQEAFADTSVGFTDTYYEGMAIMYNVENLNLSFSEWSDFKYTINGMVDDGTLSQYLEKYDFIG